MTDAQRAEALRLADALDMTGAETPEGGDALDAAAALLRVLAAVPAGWQPIETAPKNGRAMFVVQALDVCNSFTGNRPYTTDPYCVWPDDICDFARWPHPFPPTHWMPLPAAPHTAR